MVHPAAERFLMFTMQQQLQSLHMLYIEWIKRLACNTFTPVRCEMWRQLAWY
jgi:hypothetical protein